MSLLLTSQNRSREDIAALAVRYFRRRICRRLGAGGSRERGCVRGSYARRRAPRDWLYLLGGHRGDEDARKARFLAQQAGRAREGATLLTKSEGLWLENDPGEGHRG